MDLKFKKLLLLTMQINEANEIMMKASTKKIVNLQLFANVGVNLVPNNNYHIYNKKKKKKHSK
jgi:hypothetical protein